MRKPKGPGAARPREVAKDFYSPGEFARKVGRSPDTVRAWIRAGQLAAEVDAAGSYRIPREVYEAGLNAVAPATTQAPPPRPPVPPARARDADPEPWNILEGLEPTDTVSVEVSRDAPDQWQGRPVGGFLGHVSGKPVMGEILGDIAQRWGGGSFTLKVYAGGRYAGALPGVKVAGEPKVHRDGQGQRDDGREKDRDGGAIGQLRRELEELKKPRPAETIKTVIEVAAPVVRELVGALASRRDAGPGPLDVVKIIGEVRGLLAPATTDPAGLAEVRSAYRAGIEDGMERSGGAPATSGEQGVMDQIIDVVKQAAPAFAPLAAAWLARQAGLAAPATHQDAPALTPGAQATEVHPMANQTATSTTHGAPIPTGQPSQLPPPLKAALDSFCEELTCAPEARQWAAFVAYIDAVVPVPPDQLGLIDQLVNMGPKYGAQFLAGLDPRFNDAKIREGLADFIKWYQTQAEAEAAAEGKA